MTNESKLEKDIKKLYIGYEDRNPINKELFKLAKKAIKKGETSFNYIQDFDIDPINEEDFRWEDININSYYDTLNSHIEYLNKKFNGYFQFKINKKFDCHANGYCDSYSSLMIIYTIQCNKIVEEGE